jgi:predicted O-methyltransferase YrrM
VNVKISLKKKARALINYLTDEIIKLLNYEFKQIFSIKSHLTIKERIKLYVLSKGKNTILEIGSYLGASACCFGAALKKSRIGKLFCIDTWNNDAMSEGYWDTHAEFTKNTVPFAEFIIPVRGFSTEVVEQVESHVTQLDLLFIDGDHSYEGVKADWEAYKHFLKPGSIVVFHDWGWAEGVKRVVEEDVKPVVSYFNSLPNMWYGTIKA